MTKASCSSFLGNGKSSEFPLSALSNVCYCFRLFLFGAPSCALSEATAWQVSLGTSLSADCACVTHTNTNSLTCKDRKIWNCAPVCFPEHCGLYLHQFVIFSAFLRVRLQASMKRERFYFKSFLGQIMLWSPGGGAPFGLWPVSPSLSILPCQAAIGLCRADAHVQEPYSDSSLLPFPLISG